MIWPRIRDLRTLEPASAIISKFLLYSSYKLRTRWFKVLILPRSTTIFILFLLFLLIIVP